MFDAKYCTQTVWFKYSGLIISHNIAALTSSYPQVETRSRCCVFRELVSTYQVELGLLPFLS